MKYVFYCSQSSQILFSDCICGSTTGGLGLLGNPSFCFHVHCNYPWTESQCFFGNTITPWLTHNSTSLNFTPRRKGKSVIEFFGPLLLLLSLLLPGKRSCFRIEIFLSSTVFE